MNDGEVDDVLPVSIRIRILRQINEGIVQSECRFNRGCLDRNRFDFHGLGERSREGHSGSGPAYSQPLSEDTLLVVLPEIPRGCDVMD